MLINNNNNNLQIVWIFIILFIIFVKNLVKTNVRVSVENGLINGLNQTFEGSFVNIFLGIPYALPPIGKYRFQRPVPVKKWTKPINAYNWPNACYQTPQNLPLMQNKNLSEDCLYLNVFSPQDTSLNKTYRAVMFWIFGGGFLHGSASELEYNPIVLAAKGDVVVVTINYRLAALGLLYTGTGDASGNMALWDQALALKWVRSNIHSFGGDPNRITIFGQSAGSQSVSAHILSPVSRNLYRNAIMMSGGALNYGAVDEPNNVIKYWLKQANLVGCNDGHNKTGKFFTKKIIKCLTELPADVLATIPSEPIDHSDGRLENAKLFVIDRQFIPNKPIKMLKTKDFKQSINLLIGDVEDEGSSLLSLYVDPIKYSPSAPKDFTFSEAYNELKQMSNSLSSIKPINGKQVSELYFMGLSDKSDSDLLRRTIGIAFGDYLISCPAIEFAKTLFERNKNQTNIYQYYYNMKLGATTLAPVFACAEWMGVCHQNDVLPVFGLPFLQSDNFSDRERDISEQMIKFFTTFAKTGKPSLQIGVQWPKYYSLNNRTIAPYYEIAFETNSKTNFNYGLKTDVCDHLWGPYMGV